MDLQVILRWVLPPLLGLLVTSLWRRIRNLEQQLATIKDKAAMDERARVAMREIRDRERQRTSQALATLREERQGHTVRDTADADYDALYAGVSVVEEENFDAWLASRAHQAGLKPVVESLKQEAKSAPKSVWEWLKKPGV